MTKINPMSQSYEWDAQQLGKKPGAQGSQSILEQRSGLSVNDFLKIMAAEMQNQSPMGGSEGGGSKTDYVSQLAQFTSLEQMGEIVENLNYFNAMSQQQYAFSLIGKDAKILVEETDKYGKPVRDDKGNVKMQEIIGTVDKVRFVNGVPMVTVDNKDYNLGNIMEVGSKGEIKPTETDSDKDPDGTTDKVDTEPPATNS